MSSKIFARMNETRGTVGRENLMPLCPEGNNKELQEMEGI
jgi:hypothetical protein